jgi:hypothetical protein
MVVHTWIPLRQEDCKFKANMDNLARPCLKTGDLASGRKLLSKSRALN